MSKRTRFFVTLFVVVLLALTTVLSAFAGSDNYRAHLRGSSEVPAVDTNAQGQAIVQFSSDSSSLYYKLIVANIENVFAAHIHCGAEGENRPVGVTLFGGATVSPDGILAENTVTAPNPGNACGWETLADVHAAIDSGNAYVNVHTTANPGGEIRGQLH